MNDGFTGVFRYHRLLEQTSNFANKTKKKSFPTSNAKSVNVEAFRLRQNSARSTALTSEFRGRINGLLPRYSLRGRSRKISGRPKFEKRRTRSVDVCKYVSPATHAHCPGLGL